MKRTSVLCDRTEPRKAKVSAGNKRMTSEGSREKDTKKRRQSWRRVFFFLLKELVKGILEIESDAAKSSRVLEA